MLNRNQLIQHWKKWMNRNRSFSKSEMEELESHLWEEMDEMVATEGCSEEEAFHQVITKIGNRKAIHAEFKKTKRFSISKINSWAHDHLWQIVVSFILILILIFSDSIYANTHFQEKMEIQQETVSSFDISSCGLNQEVSLSLFEPAKWNKSNKPTWSKNYLFLAPIGSQTSDFNIFGINPITRGIINLHPTYFYFIYDNADNLWISKTTTFNSMTKKFKMNTPKNYIEHEYTYGAYETKYDLLTRSYITINQNNRLSDLSTIYNIQIADNSKSQTYYPDYDLTNFISVYDEKFQTIQTDRSVMYYKSSQNETDLLTLREIDSFFSEPDRSTYILLKDQNASFLLRLEIFKLLPKKTVAYLKMRNGKSIYVQYATVEEKRYELHWNLLKNIKEPIHLHQAMLTSIQKFFKASSDKNNQPNSFDTKRMEMYVDS